MGVLYAHADNGNALMVPRLEQVSVLVLISVLASVVESLMVFEL